MMTTLRSILLTGLIMMGLIFYLAMTPGQPVLALDPNRSVAQSTSISGEKETPTLAPGASDMPTSAMTSIPSDTPTTANTATQTDTVTATLDGAIVDTPSGTLSIPTFPPAPIATLQVVVPPGPYAVGQILDVDLVVNTIQPMRGFEIALSFTPTVLRCESLSEGTFFNDWALPNGATTIMVRRGVINHTAGTVSPTDVAILGGPIVNDDPDFVQGPSGRGVLLTYRFTILANGVADINVSSAVFGDNLINNPRIIPVNIQNGQVIVGAPPEGTLTPTVGPLPTTTPVTLPTETPGPVVSPDAATLQVAIPDGPHALGDTFNVLIKIQTSREIRGVGVAISFNPQALRCDQVVEGTFFSSWARDNQGATLVTLGAIDNLHGAVSTTGITLLDGPTPEPGAQTLPGPTGEGVLLTYRFTLIGKAVSDIHITHTSVIDNQVNNPGNIPINAIDDQLGLVNLEVPPGAVAPGTSFIVNLTLNTKFPVAGFQFEASFDRTILECQSVAIGPYFNDWMANHAYYNASLYETPLTGCDNANGKVHLGGVGIIGAPNGQGPSGFGRVYILQFRSRAVGSSPLALSNLVVAGAVIQGLSRSLPVLIDTAHVTVTDHPQSLTTTPAPTTSGTTQIDGSVNPFLQIAVDPAVNFGQLAIGKNTTSGALVVRCNTNYQVDVSDANPLTAWFLTEFHLGLYKNQHLFEPLSLQAIGFPIVDRPGGALLNGNVTAQGSHDIGQSFPLVFIQNLYYADPMLPPGETYHLVLTFNAYVSQ